MMTETYDRDLRELASRLDLALDHRRDRITTMTKAPIEEKQVDILRERLTPEYELLEALDAAGRVRLQREGSIMRDNG
jgi:hypothetical protein